MTKEILQEDLVKRSAGDGGGAAAAGAVGEGGNVWHEVIGLENGQAVSWTWILILGITGFLALFLCSLCICCCFRHGNSNGKKKKGGATAKKTGYFRAKMCPTKPPRNPHPVSNPDKGAHYLKKSPSPTGAKSPPGGGGGINSVDDFLQRSNPQGKKQPSYAIAEGDLTPTNELSPATASSSASRRASCPATHHHNAVAGGPVSVRPTALLGSSSSSATVGQLGRLRCTVKYCFEKNALVVTINTCDNLPAKDLANKSSDPYVKLQLLPEKQHKVKTRVMRRTLNPVYDEDFTFYGVNFNQLSGLTLHFVVLSFDRYSRDDVIGEVLVDLDTLDLSSSDHQPIALVREITPRSLKLKSQGRGEILVSLCYQPAANRITAVVLKARNLPKMDITGLSDPYVKIYLLYNDQRISKKKTHVKKRTLNPVFNESFVFELPNISSDVDEQGLKNISLEFLLLDWDRVTKNEVIGRLDLGGSSCSGSALHHWNEVIASPRRQIAEWHKLQE